MCSMWIALSIGFALTPLVHSVDASSSYHLIPTQLVLLPLNIVTNFLASNLQQQQLQEVREHVSNTSTSSSATVVASSLPLAYVGLHVQHQQWLFVWWALITITLINLVVLFIITNLVVVVSSSCKYICVKKFHLQNYKIIIYKIIQYIGQKSSSRFWLFYLSHLGNKSCIVIFLPYLVALTKLNMQIKVRFWTVYFKKYITNYW